MKKTRLFIFLLLLTGCFKLVYALDVVFLCENRKDRLDKLDGFPKGDFLDLFKQGKKIYHLIRLTAPNDPRCQKYGCVEWVSPDKLIKLWYDAYISPNEGYLEIVQLNGEMKEYRCPIDA